MSIEISTLKMFSTACDQASENDVRRALQAVIEKKNSGESSLDDKIVAEFEGFGFTETNFRERILMAGQPMKRHRNGGGWVPAKQMAINSTEPYVADTVYVGPLACVTGNARIDGDVFITDYVRVKDNARIDGDVHLSGRVVVKENAYLSRNAHISGNAIIGGYAHVGDDAMACDHVQIVGNAILCDNASAQGNAYLTDYAHVGGEAYVLGSELIRHGISKTREQVIACKLQSKF